jgi:hypothetical protein
MAAQAFFCGITDRDILADSRQSIEKEKKKKQNPVKTSHKLTSSLQQVANFIRPYPFLITYSD